MFALRCFYSLIVAFYLCLFSSNKTVGGDSELQINYLNKFGTSLAVLT